MPTALAPRPLRPPRLGMALVLALALVATACGSSDGPATAPYRSPAGEGGTTAGSEAQLNALVASYELVADRPQRFLLGLIDNQQRGAAYGTVELSFAYGGTSDRPLGRPRPGPTATAGFRPIPGQAADPARTGPALVNPSEVIGVYGAEGVSLDAVGFWQVTATVELEGGPVEASASFEVIESPVVPAVGDPAPRTRQRLAGDPGVAARAVDSRAGPEPGGPVPDPELHSTTVADALAAGRPTMVVVSTPTYCQSRFCGPITDAVSALAARHGDRMDFVHLEVWEDFDTQTLNPAAPEWIFPPGSDGANEPWVFVVDGSGTIVERFDNVATEAELARAADEVLG
ncbi:MAG: hypothetical protein ACRDZ9_09565 [Acidimicrobiales bacterium]